MRRCFSVCSLHGPAQKKKGKKNFNYSSKEWNMRVSYQSRWWFVVGTACMWLGRCYVYTGFGASPHYARELFNNDATLSTAHFTHFRYFLSFLYFFSNFVITDFRNWSLFDEKWLIALQLIHSKRYFNILIVLFFFSPGKTLLVKDATVFYFIVEL